MAHPPAKNGTGGTPTLRAARNLAAVLGGGYTPLPRRIRQSKLRQSTKMVYNSLCSFFQLSEMQGKECAWPTHEQIALDIGEAHPNTVATAIKELLKHNIIMRQRRGQGLPDLYWLVDEEDWTLPTEEGPPTGVTKNVDLGSQKTESQGHKEPRSASTVLVPLDSQQNVGQDHRNSDSLYKDNKGRNNEPRENKEQQPRERGATADAVGLMPEAEADGGVRGPADEGGGTTGQHTLDGGIVPVTEKSTKKTRAAKKTQTEASGAPEGEKRNQGQRAGLVRESMEHQEGEAPEDFAAREYLSRVRGWGSCGRPPYVRWRLDLAPIVEQTGEEGFRDWITWLLSDPWFKENAYILKPARLLQEFEDWWNKPEPRPLRRKGWAPKRDDGRAENNRGQVAELHICVSCNEELGAKHQSDCALVKRGVVRAGSPITREHCDEKWAIGALNNNRQRGAV